jgi:hypothetical protein
MEELLKIWSKLDDSEKMDFLDTIDQVEGDGKSILDEWYITNRDEESDDFESIYVDEHNKLELFEKRVNLATKLLDLRLEPAPGINLFNYKFIVEKILGLELDDLTT